MLSGGMVHWERPTILGEPWKPPFTRIAVFILANDKNCWSGLKAEVESRGGIVINITALHDVFCFDQ
jgi:hypothetical protein